MIGFKDGVMWRGQRPIKPRSREAIRRKRRRTRAQVTPTNAKLKCFVELELQKLSKYRCGVKVHSIRTNVCVMTIRTLEGSKVELDIFDSLVYFSFDERQNTAEETTEKVLPHAVKKRGLTVVCVYVVMIQTHEKTQRVRQSRTSGKARNAPWLVAPKLDCPLSARWRDGSARPMCLIQRNGLLAITQLTQ